MPGDLARTTHSWVYMWSGVGVPESPRAMREDDIVKQLHAGTVVLVIAVKEVEVLGRECLCLHCDHDGSVTMGWIGTGELVRSQRV